PPPRHIDKEELRQRAKHHPQAPVEAIAGAPGGMQSCHKALSRTMRIDSTRIKGICFANQLAETLRRGLSNKCLPTRYPARVGGWPHGPSSAIVLLACAATRT